MPENAAPENAAPENAAPENAAPENAAPENAAPENAAPENAAPESVTDNPAKMRYEIHQHGEVAGYITYAREGSTIIFLHTETDPQFRGAGLGARLVSGTLDDARKRGLGVLPYCPFVRDWMVSHPEYADLVPDGQRAGFGL